MNTWQSIESAPTDGKRVLLGRFTGRKHEYEGIVQVDYYRQPKDKQGYIGWGKFNPRYWPPTHWMPLPPSPLSASNVGKSND